ncbi:MAG: helix-turn-helix transcriptional regulator [Bacteroidetes bacterium]|nr:helix-turn-helix transcriptional regulator [Bacteroidota bacterium]
MNFQEFSPSDNLKPYVKCYYTFESERDTAFEDTVFPSGLMEIIFNLGSGTWETYVNHAYRETPPIELWGQIIKPLAIRSKGKHTMFGIKFFSHTPACFLREELAQFNNRVVNLSDLLGNPINRLHAQLLETPDTNKRINLIENFLVKRLAVTEEKNGKVAKVANILSSIKRKADDHTMGDIAFQHGITPRYLHKLINQYTGLSPKSLNKISRFQQSLKLITQNTQPLTSIAYDCGYFDQSHFIRDFKSFTSVTPTAYLENSFSLNQVVLQ